MPAQHNAVLGTILVVLAAVHVHHLGLYMEWWYCPGNVYQFYGAEGLGLIRVISQIPVLRVHV